MEQEVIKILKRTGALITDSHFVGTSGRHFATYINKDALFPHTAESSRMGELFAQRNQDLDIDVVVAPALGGIILSQWTAFHLSRLKGKEILGVYTEKTPEGDQVLKRGYDKLVAGKRILVLEDLTTTGGSVQKVLKNVLAAGGNVLAVSVMVNRDPILVTSESVGAPLRALATLVVPSYTQEECPLCRADIPVNTTVGHGKKFLESKAAA